MSNNERQNEAEIMRRALTEAKVIAVVGLSDNPSRTSHSIAHYLQTQGYRIVPVNPEVNEVLGERAYPDLISAPFDVDIVNIFRRSSAVGAHVNEAIEKGTKMIWMQVGVYDPAAAERAQRAGIDVVMNKCIAVVHRLYVSR